MGAWIETSYLPYFAKNYQVAPYMGAWIETIPDCWSSHHQSVAPYMGAWIETWVGEHEEE